MAESVTGLSTLSSARSSASRSGNNIRSSPAHRASPNHKKRRDRRKKGSDKDLSELKENLASGKKLTIKGKGGNFKTHTSRGNVQDVGGKRGALGGWLCVCMSTCSRR